MPRSTAVRCCLALLPVLGGGCDRVYLGEADMGKDAAVTREDGPATGTTPVVTSINGGQPVAVSGGGAQLTVAGQHLIATDGQPLVDALLNGHQTTARVVGGQLTLVTDASTLTRPELPGVAELALRSLAQPALGSQGLLFRYYNADTPAFRAQSPQLAASPLPVAVGDLDGDGRLDRVDATAQGALSFKLTGGGTATDILTAGQKILGLALADLNGDARLDLIAVYLPTGGTSSAAVYYRRETTGVVFDLVATLPLGNGSAGAAGIAVGDLNSDGLNDLSITLFTAGTATPYSLQVFLGATP